MPARHPYDRPTDPAKRHSAALTDGPDRAGARAMLKAIGFTDEDLAKPIVGVGEIALLRDVPRTASVRAVGQIRGYTLDRAAFLEAVTGHPQGRAAASDRVAERLAADAERSGLH